MNKKILIPVFLLITVFTAISAFGQGCVAIRGMTSCNGNVGGGAILNKGEAFVGADYRFFKSFRHFRGTEEETYRLEGGTEVINNSHFFDLNITYGISDRWFANAILPFVYHSRSSMYEHGGNPPNGLGERHSTSSYGLADVRLGVGYWLFNPTKSPFNYSLSLGLKMPTGDYSYTDEFYNQGPDRNETITTVVDQSIQPGDGGWAPTLELQGFHPAGESLLISLYGLYMFNYKESNGVLTRRGTSEFACPDQFAARVGAFYLSKVPGLNFYLEGRLEGIPVYDAIGESDAYRRPGYAVSIEPGINYTIKNASFTLNVPIAVARNRTQSVQDKQRTLETGVYRHGDAAFADYLINFNMVYKIGSGSKSEIPEMQGNHQ